MRFGVIQRKRPKYVHRHGDVVFFRHPCRHRERFWTIVFSLLVWVALALGLHAAIDAGEPHFSTWIGPLVSLMFFPALFIVFTIVTPQRSLLITPRGVCVASTFRRRRRWMRWDEVTGVRPGMGMIRSDTGQPLILGVGGLSKAICQEKMAALELHLVPHFDLTQPTAYAQHFAKTRRRFSRAWCLDRIALLAVVAMFLGMQSGKLFCRTNPALAFALTGTGGVCMLVWLRRYVRRVDRDNWIPRRTE